ncbi:glycoside hydrolase family 26 protein [Gonapodya prolifera JEL478]|uniref:Glycoside hydrolase family 26 protein n=1 Tax=Gonapodya prolifera (strain JEL478) TaxID=1344416 RepID=A0A139B047_GONPJ|nr:glycoside hydrolase family 26 protein [Gonapodya prolifera JEL478]|eukprot:KXS22344.1 glycoside hydrolase family 26 protein [Gonapodya prolifera JEL478]
MAEQHLAPRYPNFTPIIELPVAPRAHSVIDDLTAYPLPTLYGVYPDWGKLHLLTYVDAIQGHVPAVFGSFSSIGTTFDPSNTFDHVKQILSLHAHRVPVLLLTLEAWEGLDKVSDAALHTLKQTLHRVASLNVKVIVRWCHEMNGSWYPWAGPDKAELYRSTFRRVADVVHNVGPSVAMMWSPNVFIPGQGEDQYEIYYPGDDVVDWTGLSVYHFGNSWPWKNEVPSRNTLVAKIRSFHETYSASKRKPFSLSETSAALHIPGKANQPPAPATGQLAELEARMKAEWASQLYLEATQNLDGGIALIGWFEYLKFEENEWRDFRLATSPNIGVKMAMDKVLERGHLTFAA